MARRFNSSELLRNSLDRIMDKLWQEYMISIIGSEREVQEGVIGIVIGE